MLPGEDVGQENGKQMVLQSDFKERDKRFNRDQTISSALVALDLRGGGVKSGKYDQEGGFD